MYQRLSAAYQNATVTASVPSPDGGRLFASPRATVHAVMGAGGADFTKNANFAQPPPWSEFVTYAWGYARVTAHNSSAMSWEYVDSSTGLLVDRVTIVQDLSAPWADQAPIGPGPNAREDSAPVVIGLAAGSAAVVAIIAASFFVTGRLQIPCSRGLPSRTPRAYNALAEAYDSGVGATAAAAEIAEEGSAAAAATAAKPTSFEPLKAPLSNSYGST